MKPFLIAFMVLGIASAAGADQHYFSLKKIFPSGKCAPVIPNYESMKHGFSGGEITEYRIYDGGGEVVEVITSFVSEELDQWALVGSKTETQVIFCLYASGIGPDSVRREAMSPK